MPLLIATAAAATADSLGRCSAIVVVKNYRAKEAVAVAFAAAMLKDQSREAAMLSIQQRRRHLLGSCASSQEAPPIA